MKSQPLTWALWGGALLLAGLILSAVFLLLFQGLYWLRFDRWYDLTAPAGPAFFGAGDRGSHWRGVEEISSWMSSAPVELWTFAAALVLLVLFTLVRISSRR